MPIPNNASSGDGSIETLVILEMSVNTSDEKCASVLQSDKMCSKLPHLCIFMCCVAQ